MQWQCCGVTAWQGLRGAPPGACPSPKPWHCATALATQRFASPACWTAMQWPRPPSRRPAGCPCWPGSATRGDAHLFLCSLCPSVPGQVGRGGGLPGKGGGLSSARACAGSSSLATAGHPSVPRASGGREEDEGFFWLPGCPWQKGAGVQGTTHAEQPWSGPTNLQGLLNVQVGQAACRFRLGAPSPSPATVCPRVLSRDGARAHWVASSPRGGRADSLPQPT